MSPSKRKSAAETSAPDRKEATPQNAVISNGADPREPKNDSKAVGTHKSAAEHHGFEGDYRPASTAALRNEPRIDSLQGDFLTRLADALNT
ncbi:MAG: hypothetical protein ACRD28_02345, partial [Acidobacteriaceae bacterium]